MRRRRLRHITVAAAVALGVVGAAAPPAGAAITRPAVSNAHVASQTSTTIRLAWHNPSAALFAGTVVRYAQGGSAPVTPTAGRLAGRAPRGAHTLEVRGLRPGVHYAFALFARYPQRRFAHRVTVSAVTGPAPVTGVAPFDHDGNVTVEWTNPHTSSFTGLVVRFAQGGRPPARGQGTRVRLSAPKASSARLPALTPNTKYSVSIWAHDATQHFSTLATNTFTTRDVARHPRGTVTGQVTDRAGHPLAGVLVGVEDELDIPATSATTGSDGRYTLTIIPGGYGLDFYGANATGGNSDATGYAGSFAAATVVAGHITAGVDARLPAGAAATGRVTDAAGHPLAGVTPYVEPPQPYVQTDTNVFSIFVFGGVQTSPTAADGTFTEKGLPGTAAQFCFDTTRGPITGGDAAGYAGRCRQRAVILSAGKTESLGDVVLQPAPNTATLTGTVTSSGGAPLGNALVEVQRRDGFDGGYAYTAADGSYRIGGLSAGRYDVCADPQAADANPSDPGDQLTCLPSAVRVPAGQTTAAPPISLQRGAALAGKITGPDGKPLAGVYVDVESAHFASGGSAETDSRGQFVVRGLPPGRYRVCFDPARVPSAKLPTGVAGSCYDHRSFVAVQVGAIRLGIDARLGVGGAVSGTVTDDRGRPLSPVAVDVESVTDGFGALGGGAVTGARGHYKVVGLAPGKYQVCFFDLDPDSVDEACHRGAVTVRAGTTVRHVDAVLSNGGAIRVSVQDQGHHPVAGVDAAAVGRCNRYSYCHRIRPLGRNGTIAASLTTEPDGTALLSGLPAGEYAVCLYAYQGATRVGDSPTGYVDSCDGTSSFDVTVTKDHTTTVTRTLDPAGAVSGTITDAGGHPLAGVRVTVAHSGASDYGSDDDLFDFPVSEYEPAADTITGPDGTYTIHGVAPGTRTVCVDASAATGGASAAGYLDQCVGGQPGVAHGGTGVAVTAGQTASADLALAGGSSISGRITDVLGHPLLYSTALVFAGDGKPLAEADANAAGRYTIDRLPAGTYTVCFVAFRMAGQCYRGVPWGEQRLPAGATPVSVATGDGVTGIDAAMRW